MEEREREGGERRGREGWKGRRMFLPFYCLFRLYSDSSNRPKYNLVFILSGGGKFNYFGTKGVLEEDSDDSLLLSSVDYVLCLDSLLNPEGSDSLYLHVSKPPKEGSKPYAILQALNQVWRRNNCSYLEHFVWLHSRHGWLVQRCSWKWCTRR